MWIVEIHDRIQMHNAGNNNIICLKSRLSDLFLGRQIGYLYLKMEKLEDSIDNLVFNFGLLFVPFINGITSIFGLEIEHKRTRYEYYELFRNKSFELGYTNYFMFPSIYVFQIFSRREIHINILYCAITFKFQLKR